MLVKELSDLLSNSILNNDKTILIKSNNGLEEVVDIYKDKKQNLVLYIGEYPDNYKPYLIKDLIEIIKNLSFKKDSKIYVDCNEPVSISNKYINKKGHIIFDIVNSLN